MSDIIRAAEHHTVMDAIKPCPKPEKRAKKAKNPPIDKEAFIKRRLGVAPYGWGLCDCGCGKHGQDLHHCFIGRKAGHPELDDDRNLVLVNHDEHISRIFDNRAMRKYFWNLQCLRYGEKIMLEWVNSLPEKMRARIDWL